jgi:hypothetical protein
MVPTNNYHSNVPAPCSKPVSPISGNQLVVAIPVNFTYTPKDQAEGSVALRQIVLGRLNEDGKGEYNTFELQNGQNLNFTLTFSLSNNSEMYSGSLSFSGWGQGFIHTFYTSGTYNDPTKMVEDLTDQAYAFIRGGWHDSRPSCPQQ